MVVAAALVTTAAAVVGGVAGSTSARAAESQRATVWQITYTTGNASTDSRQGLTLYADETGIGRWTDLPGVAPGLLAIRYWSNLGTFWIWDATRTDPTGNDPSAVRIVNLGVPAAPGHYTVDSFLGVAAPPGVHYQVDVAKNPGVDVSNMAAGKPTTASSSFWIQQPPLAVDENPFTYWNSGNFPPQWIEVDLGSPVSVGEVALSITQLPNGYTVHSVYGKLSATDPYTLLHVFAGPTVDSQTLRTTLDTPFTARYIRIQSTTSPSWVAWREVGVYPAPTQAATG
ncbi:MAG: hypothetical protein C5B48_10045 [Candidatus Rokuibacteriota bacterium]|nr:MAG: hypothetical protein C5B48_10045 [Candidatus Rokubacteria bacterium]